MKTQKKRGRGRGAGSFRVMRCEWFCGSVFPAAEEAEGAEPAGGEEGEGGGLGGGGDRNGQHHRMGGIGAAIEHQRARRPAFRRNDGGGIVKDGAVVVISHGRGLNQPIGRVRRQAVGAAVGKGGGIIAARQNLAGRGQGIQQGARCATDVAKEAQGVTKFHGAGIQQRDRRQLMRRGTGGERRADGVGPADRSGDGRRLPQIGHRGGEVGLGPARDRREQQDAARQDRPGRPPEEKYRADGSRRKKDGLAGCRRRV